MLTIHTLRGHVRMSTQDLLLAIEQAVGRGETDFFIDASGQHDIGGPLWNAQGAKLTFTVANPGQRAGGMCLPGTEVVVNGPAPADVGWLNAGGQVTVRGDAGDTAGHCAASGRIYIGGRAGTRSGSLMKKDPLYEAPELWILKNTGSFSFEFMGGGTAVVCGCDSQTLPSVLGDRPCVGMVGGVVYFRGPVAELPEDVRVEALDEADVAFLDRGLDGFLEAVQRPRRRAELSVWKQWRKIVPVPFGERSGTKRPSLAQWRRENWLAGGIFADVFPDRGEHVGLVARGVYRLRVPEWRSRAFEAPCEHACPAGVPTQLRHQLLRAGRDDDALRLVLDWTPFPASVCGTVCPNPCMQACTRAGLDHPVQIGALGLESLDVKPARPKRKTGRKVAVIGGGPAGLACAWRLARRGHEVEVFEAGPAMGGKMEQAIPRERLPEALLQKEIARIRDMGVAFRVNCRVDRAKFAEIRASHDAVVVAAGGHVGRIFNWPGRERCRAGIDFMKAVNRGLKPKVAEQVVVIGAGNAGMDAAAGAYRMGARKVTCIDVQKPAAFEHEMARIRALGGEIAWPCQTKEITAEGVLCEDGRFFPAGDVIVAVGETPDLSFLPEGAPMFRAWLAPGQDQQILEGVFAAGDCIKPGLIASAIGSGSRAADACDAWLAGQPYAPKEESAVAPERLHLQWFAKFRKEELPAPREDHVRCISCGACRDCGTCRDCCPEGAISRQELPGGGFAYASDPERCIGCGMCQGVCPCGVWTMRPNDPLPQ